MHISESIIQYYLETITVGYFDDNDVPPDDVRAYESLVETMRIKAIKHGDLEYLHIALAWLLANKNIDLEMFNGGRYPFDVGEMREIINYIYHRLFSDRTKPADEVLENVRLVDLTLEGWWRERPAHQPASNFPQTLPLSSHQSP